MPHLRAIGASGMANSEKPLSCQRGGAATYRWRLQELACSRPESSPWWLPPEGRILALLVFFNCTADSPRRIPRLLFLFHFSFIFLGCVSRSVIFPWGLDGALVWSGLLARIMFDIWLWPVPGGAPDPFGKPSSSIGPPDYG